MTDAKPQSEPGTARPTATLRDTALLRLLVGSTVPLPIPLPAVRPRTRGRR